MTTEDKCDAYTLQWIIIGMLAIQGKYSNWFIWLCVIAACFWILAGYYEFFKTWRHNDQRRN